MPDRDFELGQQIAELRGIVVQGFEGIHKRQDTTNGRIGKAEDRLIKLEQAKDSAEGRMRGAKASWQVIVTIATLIIAIATIILKTK